MKLSIRTKILGGYSFVIVIFLAIVLNIILTQRRISSKLRITNEDYLPKLYMVNKLSNYYHIDESIDVEKIIQNKDNTLLIQSINILHPRLLEKQLGEIEKSITSSLKRIENPMEKRHLDLILQSIDEVKKKHKDYKKILRKISRALKREDPKEALKVNAPFLKQKREIRSEISFLRRRLNNNIRSGLLAISGMEKRASIITTILSLLAILIAGGITLFALYTLSPIKKLIEGVKRISFGDYNYKLNIKSEGEIKTLANEFNNMSQSILERNNALREQQKKLLQSERMAVVGRMASHITHEVKNPLNSISLNTDLLEDELNDLKSGGGNTLEAFNLLKSVKKEIESLSSISEEYLSFARLPKGSKQKTCVNSILNDLTSLLKSELKKNNISLEESYVERIPEILTAPNQIKRAFMNIIKNAIEALKDGGKIKISTEQDKSKIKVTIEDTGKGIPKDILDHIFDPFFSTKEKGTGLGLPITQKIISEQDGEIICISTEGKGTKFEITLPINSSEKILNANV